MEFEGPKNSIRVRPSPVRSVSPAEQAGIIPPEQPTPGEKATDAASRSQTGSRIVDNGAL